MSQRYQFYFPVLIFILFACNPEKKPDDIVKVQDERPMDEKVRDKIEELLQFAVDNNKKIDDSNRLYFLNVVRSIYEPGENKAIWGDHQKIHPVTDSLIRYLEYSSYDGLFPEDYHFSWLKQWLDTVKTDTLNLMKEDQWAKADLLLTDAYMRLVQDLRQGRLQADSLAWKNDPSTYKSFFAPCLERLRKNESLSAILNGLQPSFNKYARLKKLIPGFLDTMDMSYYTYLKFPFKDSLAFIKNLKIRLGESGILDNPSTPIDSTRLSAIIKKYQGMKGMKQTGKISSALVYTLNMNDREKFNRIAITMDKYKKLPAEMPEKYIWVNIPAYYLEVWDSDSLVLQSKVICGKPATPTPILTSAISDMIIYPTWTVPASIIKAELLPGLKRNTGYLAKKGLNLLNEKGEMIDPASVNWAKYSKGIPYKVQQGSGDDNALGVIKFNFSNPFSVYLHDTNQRYLFKNSMRSLSHGCVRVQEWKKLAFYILRNDSIHMKRPDSMKVNTDSITSWIAQKEKHRVGVTYKIPLFIRYFGCEAVDGTLRFYDDIYGDDRILRERYLAGK